MTATDTAPSELVHLPLDAIEEAPDNLRGDIGDVSEMAASMKSGGVHTALTVTGGGMDGKYLLVAGHRRLAAAKQAGLATVPVQIRHYTEPERTEAMLVENMEREGLDPMEQAHGFARLVELGWTQRQIAERMFGSDKQQGRVSKLLKLVKLPEPAQQKIASGELTLEAARGLADMPAESQKRALAEGDSGNLEYAIRTEKQRIRSAEARAKFEAELKKSGVTTVDESDGAWAYIGYTYEGAKPPTGYQSYGVDHSAGDKCLVAKVGGGTTLQWYCTDPASHPQPAAPEQGDTGAGAIVDDDYRKRTEARDAAAAARREIVTRLLAEPPEKTLEHIAKQAVSLLAREHADVGVCELLGLELPTDGPDWERAWRALEAAAEDKPLRVLLGLVLDAPESWLRGYSQPGSIDEDGATDVRRHLELLQEHGYTLTDEEAAAMQPTADGEAAA